MKIAVYGLGQMGQSTIYALHKLGYEIFGVELDIKQVEKCKEQAERNRHRYWIYHNIDMDFVDGVVSCLPYSLNEELAKKYIDKQIPYFGLGGNIEISKNINDYAKEKSSTVFTDLGLAPGLVNILGNDLIGPEDDFLEMYCGGLPQENSNPLGYSVTWSVEGLLNEYKEKCLIKKNGFKKEVDGMAGFKPVKIKGKLYESFYTSGGLNHNFVNIQNVSYRTVRYPGHLQLMKWLMENLDQAPLISLLEKGCPKSEDKVLIKIMAGQEERFIESLGEIFKVAKSSKTQEYEILPQEGFSAMQVATGFSLACVVHQSLNKTGVLGYDGVDIQQLKQDLSSLGVVL